MSISLSNRTALVTGGARGIGRGIASALARAGANIVVADLEHHKAESVVDEVRSLGSEALALQLDVTDNASVAACLRHATTHFPRIDILVNNAGVFQTRLGLQTEDEEFSRCADVNVTGVWRMALALCTHFETLGGGKIVNVSSVGGRRGVDIAPAYCASKAAVINLTQSLAAALGGHNINVNAVCPGYVQTDMQETIARLREASRAPREVAAATPLKGPVTVDDVGNAVAFFASDYAASITGQALNVDCGECMN